MILISAINLDAGFDLNSVQTAAGHDIAATTLGYAVAYDSEQIEMIDYISSFMKDYISENDKTEDTKGQ